MRKLVRCNWRPANRIRLETICNMCLGIIYFVRYCKLIYFLYSDGSEKNVTLTSSAALRTSVRYALTLKSYRILQVFQVSVSDRSRCRNKFKIKCNSIARCAYLITIYIWAYTMVTRHFWIRRPIAKIICFPHKCQGGFLGSWVQWKNHSLLGRRKQVDHPSLTKVQQYIYNIYIYIYVCVCVCVWHHTKY
jgi:hypothetical protein